MAQMTVVGSGKTDMYGGNRRAQPLSTGFPNGKGPPDLLNAGFSPKLDLTDEIRVQE